MRHFLCVCLFLLLANTALGDTISVPSIGSLSGFGSSEVYRGQTFTSLPSPSFADKLTVFAGPTVTPGASFRVLLTEVDSTQGFHPTKVLFESGTFTVPVLPLRSTPDSFVVNLYGLPLDANREYAFILDHFVVENGSYISMGTAVGFNYQKGFSFRFLNGPSLPAGTREDHFASDIWKIDTALDFAFTLELSTVPLPQITEQWELILDNGQGHADITLIKKQDGTTTSDGSWSHLSQGTRVSGIYTDAPVTISESNILIEATGTATNASAPLGYRTSPFNLGIDGTAVDGKGSGRFSMNFQTIGWPRSITGTWEGNRRSGHGITPGAMRVHTGPLLLLLLKK